MSTFIKIACDQCHKELDVDSVNEDVFDYGWGKVHKHDEHYCDKCWPEYADENQISPHKTCTMNCGKTVSDIRSWEEVKSTCEDCRVN